MMPGLANLQLQIMIIAIRAVDPAVVSLGATMAWTICTNRAGVWIFRPTLVCFTAVSIIILLHSAMFELFLTSGILGMSVVLRVLQPSLPLARETAPVCECGATSGVSCLGKLA